MSGTDSTGGVAGIAIIPFTYLHTNVRYLSPGDAVNLECDVLAKYAERFTNGVQAEWLLKVRAETDTAKAAPSKVTVERLTREGF
jgi:riboflavin synthase alpha subunit